MKVNIRITAARLTALLVLAALLGAGVQAAMAAEQTLTMSIGDYADIGTDPTLYKKTWPDIGGIQEYHHFTHLSPLITLDGEGRVIPWMAESYAVSDDYKTITFHLRRGAKFADGTPLNASILKFNFDRIILHGFADYGGNQTKLNTFIYYDYSEASDENTFKIHFTQGWLDMPLNLASFAYYGQFISPLDVNPAWDIKGTLKAEKKYNGLGSYYLDENESVPKQKIVLKRRHSWRDDYNFHKPKLDKIVLTLIADPQVAVMALKKGEVDYICRYWNAPLDALPMLETNPRITIKTMPETRTYFIRTAYWKEPFSGLDGIYLRKAICYALNRTEIVEGAFNGYALPAIDSMGLSPRRPDVPECCGKGYDYDIQKAKQLLVEAGWNDTDGDGILDRDGKALKNLDFVITSSSDLIWQKDLATIVQSQLKKIGIEAEIRTLEWGAYSDIILKTGDSDLLLLYNVGRHFSSTQEMKWFNMKSTLGYINYYENQNETLETAVTNAQKASSEKERDQYLCQACNILYDDAGIIPLVYEVQYAIMSDRVNGFQFGPSTMDYYLDHIEECSIED